MANNKLDLKKIKYLSEEQRRKIFEECLPEIKEDKKLLAIIKENNIPTEMIVNDIVSIREYLLTKKNCDECTKKNGGIAQCRNNPKGYYFEIYYENFEFSHKLTMCESNKKETLKAKRYRENYLWNDYFGKTQGITLNNVKPRNEKQKNIIEKITKNIQDKGFFSFYLFDNSPMNGKFTKKPFEGKSYICSIILNTAIEAGKKAAFINVPDLWSEGNKILNGSRNTNNTEPAFYRILSAIENADVLVLEDIGDESWHEYIHHQCLLPKLERRRKKNLPTIFISKNAVENLYDYSGKSTNKNSRDHFKNKIFKMANIRIRINN